MSRKAPTNVRPKPLGHNLTEPIYNAILKALAEDKGRLDLLLSLLHPSDIADLLERLPIESRPHILHRLPKDTLGEVIANASFGVQENLLELLTKEEVTEALSSLESDDVADIVQQMDDTLADQTLRIIPEIQQALLNYPEDSAGGIMQLEVVAVPQAWTVEKLLTHLRDLGDEAPSRLAAVFITDHTRRLLGTISVSRLVRQDPKSKLSEIMRTDPVTVHPEMAQTEVAKLFEKYDLSNCAVVDRNQRLLGQITFDDVLDVILEEHEYQIMKAAGLSEGSDLFAPVLQTTKERLPWLIINLATAILAAMVVAVFEDTVSRFVALAVMMPIVAGMGGNAGTQAMTVTVRGLAMNQITPQNASRLLRKEIVVGVLCGVVIGLILAVGTYAMYRDWRLASISFVAIVSTLIFAALGGNLLPRVLHRYKRDPAISAGVFVTTVTDVLGFFSFLGLAAWWLS